MSDQERPVNENPDMIMGQDQPVKPLVPAWAQQVIDDFAVWAATLGDEPPNIADPVASPDLFSFYNELCALRTEVRTGTRRTHETLSRFTETLGRFEERIGLDDDIPVEPPPDDQRIISGILETMDRLSRIGIELQQRPKQVFWRGDGDWRAWADKVSHAITIARDALDEHLRAHDICRIASVGTLFDPQTMHAVAVERTGNEPDGTVVEELTAGYMRNGTILRTAEVKVARTTNDNQQGD